ncbi:hypothetical protein VTN77DRAFT_8217 [Rasamsonia byssochlamydoides]|uniref:uncharacterized protein n=1 Tax=Rasamsonia byssochlamydoides TaxID=89139 RepID=UPI003741E945
MRFSFSFSNSTSSSPSPSPSSLPPPPPPPTPNDTLLDISPRKSSFTMTMGMSSSCAFPSWPNRPSLECSDSESTASSYLSDEDLFLDPVTPSSEAVIDEESADSIVGAPDLTTEEQIQMMRAAAEEDERRMQFLAHVHAHARAQQAFRVAQLAAAERENARRRKRRVVTTDKKRRSTSSSSKTSATTRM